MADAKSVTIKIVLGELAGKAPERDCETPIKRLQERVVYAIDCIEADTNREAAVKFCQELYRKLDKMKHPTEALIALKESILPVIQNYGVKANG